MVDRSRSNERGGDSSAVRTVVSAVNSPTTSASIGGDEEEERRKADESGASTARGTWIPSLPSLPPSCGWCRVDPAGEFVKRVETKGWTIEEEKMIPEACRERERERERDRVRV